MTAALDILTPRNETHAYLTNNILCPSLVSFVHSYHLYSLKLTEHRKVLMYTQTHTRWVKVPKTHSHTVKTNTYGYYGTHIHEHTKVLISQFEKVFKKIN